MAKDIIYSRDHDTTTKLPTYICESCLNGIVEAGEQCDPWTYDEPGCIDCVIQQNNACVETFAGYSTCIYTPDCGDGVVDEECDDGNL